MCSESHQVLAQLLDTLLVIGTQLPESPALRLRLVEVAYKVTQTLIQSPYTEFVFTNSTGLSAQTSKCPPRFSSLLLASL